MKVIKPKKPSELCSLDLDDPFYKYSHGYDIQGCCDFTLCGIGSEEWVDVKEVKKITCPQCLAIIKECKNYKR